jgi:hypothetical protein
MSISNDAPAADLAAAADPLDERARETLANAGFHYRRSALFSASYMEQARTMLVELWRVGIGHGVQPDDWAFVTSLSSNVLDVLRSEPPQTGETAEAVVDAVLAMVRTMRGDGAASRRDLFSIYLHATPLSLPANPITTYGGTGLVLQLERGGWQMWVEHGDQASRSVSVRSGYDQAGIEGAAQVAIDVNEGRHGDRLFQHEQ